MSENTKDLERYLRLKHGPHPTPISGPDHSWGFRFLSGYPVRCPLCGCQTRSPFDSTDIIHDIEGCKPCR